MIQDPVNGAFFTLLKAGLWEKSPPPENISLTESEWDQLYSLSRSQTVEGIIYDGILRLPPQSFPPKSLMLKWTALIALIEQRNKKMNVVIERVGGFFVKNKLNFLLLKGQGLSVCYDKPLHRVCGDIDLYFCSKEAFERANCLMAGNGLKIIRIVGTDANYAWKGLIFEHHSRLFDIYNPFVARYLKKLEREDEGNKIWANFGCQKIALPSPLLTHIQVNAHILKHSLSFGIGLRQLCDSARVCYAYHAETNGELLKKIYRRIGIYRWIQILNKLLVNSLGMPAQYLPFPLDDKDEAGWMMDEVLESGNFGFADQRFGGISYNPWEKRSHPFRHRLHRLGLNYRHAPSEAFWFPVMQIFSRVRSRIKNK